MRIGTFNANNLFTRAKAMNLGMWAEGRGILEDVERLNELISEPHYTEPAKAEIKALLEKYEFDNRNKRNRPFEIVQSREKLFVAREDPRQVEVKAAGRGDWVGWVELARNVLSAEEVQNTARVIQAVGADILCVVEVESRITLDRFNVDAISRFMPGYSCNLLIDGNDPRGIDIGLLSRHPIVSVRSHIDLRSTAPGADDERVFSRDCPEFEVKPPAGPTIWILGNHFKSKGYGTSASNNARREAQARAVAEIYGQARQRSEYVVVAGDLNDTPDSAPLQPLLAGTDLRDAMSHPSYQGPPGTYRTSRDKFDYLLLSPELWARVRRVGVERGGIYAPRAGNPFPTVTSLANQASDHAAVWADVEL
jgi:endonuclease/exonuclease/phosphatase family metal-dependent hydrolase